WGGHCSGCNLRKLVLTKSARRRCAPVSPGSQVSRRPPAQSIEGSSRRLSSPSECGQWAGARSCGGDERGENAKRCRMQLLENGVKTRNGWPLWFLTVQGSNKRLPLKLSTAIPIRRNASLRLLSCSTTDGS